MTRIPRMYTLYSMQRSGNSYKVRLALAQLGIPYRKIEVDILRGESRTPEFLTLNPSGQVPLIEVAPGRHLAESNAILWYVAAKSPLVPQDEIHRAAGADGSADRGPGRRSPAADNQHKQWPASH